MIKINFNGLGMIIFSCNHRKGYAKGKGKNICKRCEEIVIKRLENKIFNKEKP